MQLTAVCFTLLVSFLGTTYGYDCKSNLENDVQQCYADRDLNTNQLTGDGSALLKTVQIIDDKAHCRKINLIKNTTACAMKYVKLCYGRLEGFLPDTTKMLQGMDFLCHNYADFDSQCLMHRLDNIKQCGKDILRDMAEKSTKPSAAEIICITADLSYDCSKVHLTSCPKRTKVIYLELLNKYELPTVCQDRPPGRSRISYIRANTASPAILFHPFSAMLVSMATLIFLLRSG